MAATLKTVFAFIAALFLATAAFLVLWFPVSYVIGRNLVLEGWVALWPKPIRETPEPWIAQAPGSPNSEFPTPKVLRTGTGEIVQVGDLVTLRKLERKPEMPGTEVDRGLYWIWLGFLTSRDTPFYSGIDEDQFEVDSALVGMKVGSLFHFPLRDKSRADPEGLRPPRAKVAIGGSGGAIPIGDEKAYRVWTFASAYKAAQTDQPAYLQRQLSWLMPGQPSGGGSGNIPETLFVVEKRCPGQLRVRRVAVEATGPVLVGQAVETASRRIWVREAELAAVCTDGTTMIFSHGPTGAKPPDGADLGPTPHAHWDSWFQKAWAKVPLGIRINPEPRS